ncbi:aminotransferase class I/II-fold pyridoxal phosphate-dependent enzyme [Candidatus Bipolaricaulota bacterium]|nr:aminotransferase class I/II-fold pyridoxal phosphate-dependent enzyme [Candidatus Bipolaricaulota bacterium]
MNEKELDPRTLQVMGGYGLEQSVEAESLAPPLAQSVAHPFKSAEHAEWVFDTEANYEEYGGLQGYIYTRENNPTLDIFEDRIALLEGGGGALATSSGMAAISLVALFALEAGDEIVVSNHTYTCSFELFSRTLPRFGVETKVVDHPEELSQWEEMVTENTEFMFVETPSNPVLYVGDLEALAGLADANGTKLIVDNTIATPIIQRPLEMGADVVIESVSKFISGNGTILGGVLVGEDEFIQEIRRLEYIQYGNAMAPFNAWLSLLGLESLDMRMKKHSENALEVARFLEDHSAVEKVNYPGLESHPGHELAKRQMDGFSALLSFAIDGGKEEAFELLNSLELIPTATHEGSSRSVICHPASTIFHRLTDEELEEAGILKNLLRLSVGIESADDLIKDLDRALSKI